MTADAPLTRHTVRVKDLRMCYVSGGQGPAVVLVHGWPQTSYAWRLVQPLLAHDFTVIAPDIRGAGHTTKSAAGYDADNIADDLHQLVAALGLTDVFLVGHDWGAVWAYHYAAQPPQEVAGLVNLEMVIPGTGFHEAAMVPKPKGRFFWHMGWQSVPEIPEMLIRGKEATNLRFVMRTLPTTRLRSPPTHSPTTSRRSADPAPSEPALRSISSSGSTPPRPTNTRRTKLTVPTLAYGGDALLRDAPAASMEQLADNVDAGVVERCGHLIPEERPTWLAHTLTTFFTAARPTAASSQSLAVRDIRQRTEHRWRPMPRPDRRLRARSDRRRVSPNART